MSADPGDNATPTGEMAQYLERVARLEDEKAVLTQDIAEVWTEAKSRGFDVAALKKVHALRKLKPEVRSVVGVYAHNLGVFNVLD